MYELDHMLNGQGSRQHLQHMIREAQQDKFGRNVEAALSKDKTILLLPAILVAVIRIICGNVTLDRAE